ncbi:MAG: 16S rRNA (cytidine(1402)-2'-O)-methyltransferase [Thermoanaerobacteraceae bacterium]
MADYGNLYLCPTPIGNLEDITLRVLKVLNKVDIIAAEDTRHTIKLLNYYNIKKPLTSYHEHNKRDKGIKLIEELKNGKSIALVTDAGTPGISDPGADLVKLCIEEKVKVIPLPGAVAAITALIASGLDTSSFVFEGFLPQKKKYRDEVLKRIQLEERTIIIYEAPHRLKSTISELAEHIKSRKIVIARELTKIHEEFIRGYIEDIIEKIDKEIKGEIIILIEGKKKKDRVVKNPEELLRKYIKNGISKKEAVKMISEELNISKNEIYRLSLDLEDL